MIKNIPKYNFTRFEKATIEELLRYSIGKQVESARVIKAGKNITDKLFFEETSTRILLKTADEKLLKNSTYIHYHPYPLPLSFGDILFAFKNKLKKIVAVFDDGRYSIFIPNTKIQIPTEDLIAGNQKIRKIVKKYGEDFILKNSIEFEKYKNSMHDFLQKLSQKTNSKYFSNM